MDLGHVTRSIAGGDDPVGHAGTDGIGAAAPLVRVRVALGSHADDQPRAGFRFSAAAGMSCLSRLARRAFATFETRGCRTSYTPLLSSMDHAQLCRLPPVHSVPLQ